MGLVAIGTGQSSPGTSQARPRPLLDRRQQPRSDDAQTQTLFLATLSQAISSFQTFWWIIQYLDYHSRESKKTQGKRIWSVRPKQFSLWILILVTTGNESFLKGPTVNTSFLNCRPQIKLKAQLCLSEVFLVTEGLTGSSPSPNTTTFIYSRPLHQQRPPAVAGTR